MIKNDLDITIPTTIEWEAWNGGGNCPRCLGKDLQYNTRVTLPSQPVQTLMRCRSCHYEFGSNAVYRTNNPARKNEQPTQTNTSTSNPTVCLICGKNSASALCDECRSLLLLVMDKVKTGEQLISASAEKSTPLKEEKVTPKAEEVTEEEIAVIEEVDEQPTTDDTAPATDSPADSSTTPAKKKTYYKKKTTT